MGDALIEQMADRAAYEAKVRRKVRDLELEATAEILAKSKCTLIDLDAKKLADSTGLQQSCRTVEAMRGGWCNVGCSKF